MTIRETVLKDAIHCVCGDREQDYGTPENNFALIADLWSAYRGVTFTPVDVAMMMALLKVARIRTGRGKMDSFVDLAGYAACAAEIDEQERGRGIENLKEVITCTDGRSAT